MKGFHFDLSLSTAHRKLHHYVNAGAAISAFRESQRKDDLEGLGLLDDWRGWDQGSSPLQ